MSVPRVGHALYRASRRAFPLDISYLLWAHRVDVGPVTHPPGVTYKLLTAADMQTLTDREKLEVEHSTVADCLQHGYKAVAAIADGQIASIAFFAEHSVVPHHNRAGSKFNGIGIALPPGTLYLFKAFTLPQHRGRGLNSAVIRFAMSTLCDGEATSVVATTDILNLAFQHCAEKLGFKRCGISVELSLFGRHAYRLPHAIAAETGLPTTRDDGAISMHATNQPTRPSLVIA